MRRAGFVRNVRPPAVYLNTAYPTEHTQLADAVISSSGELLVAGPRLALKVQDVLDAPRPAQELALMVQPRLGTPSQQALS